MEDAPAQRTAVLVIRLWLEADPDRGVRARITRALDVEAGAGTTVVVSSAAEIHETVDAWLSAFLSSDNQ